MAYQVIARKWRPQRFDDVVGQQAVTRTLRNALASGRLAQAFVFAGARGVGKTTTARILARALNCVSGPTPDPCGQCDACIEIAQGRDLDVLEIDAASNTGIDNVREVIISNLAISPARDRYKVFIIDEVHQLSNHSFNALLKSVEEPPPHVVFIMATTELHKIPDTIQSRAQVYEFRTIAATAIAGQLRHIADAEGISIGDDALTILARYAEGSMRDAQSAFDQVLSFAGATVTADDVASVLGLVGRDLLFDILRAVADEDASAAFALAGGAVEAGYDLRILCRELAGLIRAMTLVSIDPQRLSDPEVVFESDRQRLQELATRFSREDLLRSFDLVAQAEADVKLASQPRYALEMALLKWIHLRKLVPLADLIGQLEKGGVTPAPRAPAPPHPAAPKPAQSFAARPSYPPRPVAPPRAHDARASAGRAGAIDAGQSVCRCARRSLAGRLQGPVSCGASAAEPHVLQPARGHGAANRARWRSPGLHLRTGARDDAPAGGRAAPVAGIARRVGGRPQGRRHDRARRRHRRAGGTAAGRGRAARGESARRRPTRI